MTGPGTGTDPIDFSLPLDLNQPAITPAERDVVLDVMAFVEAALQVGAQVARVNVGGTGGEPSYPRIREILTNLGVPNVSPASGRDKFITIQLLPPQGEFPIPQTTQDALLAVFDALRDNGAAALLSQPLLQTKLPMVERTIAESLDLETILDVALHQPVLQLLQNNSAPHIHDLQAVLGNLRVLQDNLWVDLSDVRVDVDQSRSPNDFVVRLNLNALQLTDINAGGDLPQNSGAGAQDVMDARSAANNLAIDFRLPLVLRIPVDFDLSSDPAGDVRVVPGPAAVRASSVNLRDYQGYVGMMPVNVAQNPVVLQGELNLQFAETDDQGQITLEQLNDPFLNEAITATPTVSYLSGVLPVQHTMCSYLAPGAAAAAGDQLAGHL